MQLSRALPIALLSFWITSFFPKAVFSQNLVNVNNLTGTANVTIPITSVYVGDLSAPVALSYNASGLRVEDYDNSFGLGWRLIADASITRQVRGFPDDVEYQSDASYPVIKGWIRSGNAVRQTIQSLSLANGGSTVDCAGEISDATTIANNFSYIYDTEPDVFNVSAPGLSCSFVFDAGTTPVIKTIPYRDYQITYTADSYGRITSFTVINENGIKYFFDRAYLTEHYIETYNPGTTVEINAANLEVFRRDYMMYRNKTYLPGYPIGTPLKYYDDWTLSKMEDTRGNRISYTYENYNVQNPTILNKYSYKEVDILKPDGSGGFTKKRLYGITTARVFYRLLKISTFSLGVEGGTSVDNVQFSWDAPDGEDKRLMSIQLLQEKKNFELLYTIKFNAGSNTWDGYGRYFLKGLKAIHSGGTCDNVNTQFDFTYYEVNQANNTCYCAPVIPNSGGTKLDTLINAQDYWGYYNGVVGNADLAPQIYAYPDNTGVELFKVYEIPGYSGAKGTIPSSSDRTVNAHAIDGSLKKITYPTGGDTELEYENNNFYDNDVSGNVLGGGIRIKKITNNDGLGTSDVTEYSYNDLVNTSITTGRAISVPKFTIAFQNSTSYGNTTDKVKNTTYRATYDLNNEPKDILYGKVTVKKTSSTLPGIGKTIYEYNTSGSFGSANGSDWAETYNYVARTNLSTPPPCNAMAPTFLYNNNGELIYPFAPNSNFDFERGLPTKVSHYNESGQLVASEEYSYSRSHTAPAKIYGLKLDETGSTLAAYGRYWVNANVDNFLTTKISKLYNSNSSNPVTETETYEYTSPSSGADYRLLKAVRKQNSGDPAVTVSRFKYAKEYTATSSTTDFRNEAIYNFNTSLHKNVLIESSQSREESGTEKFTGASFNTFKKVTVGDVINGTTIQAFLPYETYQFVNQAGVTNYTVSSISSNTFTWDNSNYTNAPTKIEQYSPRGIPELVTDNSRIPKTILSTVLVNSIKVAEFTNAKPVNVGFSNFDGYESTGNFSHGGNSQVAGGRYSNYALNFQPNTSICRLLTKSTTTGNIVISFWLKDAAAAGDIYFCYRGSKFGNPPTCTVSVCSTTVIASYTTGSQWKYYQAIVAWPYTETYLAISLGTSAGVKIDDVLIYPDNANVTTYSYTSNTIGTHLLTAKTGINGIGNAYEYDNAGRLWITRDQFDNILEMKKYKLANRHAGQIPSIEIGYERPNYIVDVAGTFSAYPPAAYESGDCDIAPIVYTWDFGDGSPTQTSYSIPNSRGFTTINHTYTNKDMYVVTVTASSAGMNNIVAQTPAVTSTNPPPVTVDGAAGTCSPGTPVICASGITQYTSAYQCITASCGSLPSTCSGTYFTVSAVTGGSVNSVHSVQWEIAPEGSSAWTVYQSEPPNGASGGLVTSRNFHTVHTESYQMRARIRFCNSSGSTAYSNSILIKNGD